MRKLLSLVLSVSILVSSITPALGQALGRVAVTGMKRGAAVTPKVSAVTSFSTQLSRRILQNATFAGSALNTRILAGNTQGVAQHILTRPILERTVLLRNEFVTLSLVPHALTPAQRLEAVGLYQNQLQQAPRVLAVPQRSLTSFLEAAQTSPAAQPIAAVRNVLADASALGLVGTPAQAPLLLDFYKHAQGTLFEDTAALIAARGLLRMQAYGALENFLAEHAEKSVLSGVAAYAKQKALPLTVPTALENAVPPTAPAQLATFLEGAFFPNRLHADASLQATQAWMDLAVPAAAPQAEAPATDTKPTEVNAAPTLSVPVPPMPGGFVQPVMWTAAKEQTPVQPEVKAPVVEAATPVQPAEVTPAPVAKPAAQPTPVSTARSGIVYSGVPVFAIANSLKRAWNWARQKLNKNTETVPVYEEPGLHESHVRPVYASADAPDMAQIGGELVGTRSDVEMVSVGVDGFKLTVENADKVEHILHNVDLTVSSSLKNFSSEYNRLALDTNHIFELRNQTVPAKRPDHFYFALSNAHGEFAQLVEGAGKLNLSRPLRIKIQQTAAPKKAVTLPVYTMELQATQVVADVDTSLLSDVKNWESGQVIFHQNALYFRSAEGELTPLENAFIRLPKGESKYWTQILAMYPQTEFHLGVFSTMDKMPPVTYLVPSLQIGLGKTLAPVLHDMSTLGETTSSAIMLGINNVLPALMGFVHPFLKQYGEAAVFRVGAAMFTAGGLLALLSGLYGNVGTGIMSSWQLAGFLTSSVLIALGTNITRFVQNIIISANRGIVPQQNSFKKKKMPLQQDPAATYSLNYLGKRAKEVMTKKSQESIRDVVYYQKGAMFKNLGTMLFLSFPWLANVTAKGLFGADLGLDFSASYVPYTLYSLYTLHKLSKIPYKDAFPLNLTLLKSNLQESQSGAAAKIAEIGADMMDSHHPTLQNAAKQLKGAIDALVPVESRSTKKAANGLIAKYEAESGQKLEEHLLAAGRTPQEAQEARLALQAAFDSLGHRDVKLKDVMLMAGLPTSLAAMTLATLGELGLSNGLAFAMRELIGNGTAATGMVGILLYGCMFGWRIVGNVLSQRMSGGSMYAISSTASVLGPMMMAFSGGNVGTLVSGAIIACFGISNFFSQMYEYMVGLHPKYKREIALLINYTMPAGAIGASLLRLTSGIPGLDMGLAGAALAASVALTPGMLANSSIVRTFKYYWQGLKTRIKNFFRRGGGDEPPLAHTPAH